MDATMHAAVFHLQNKHYDGARPPSFFDHDDLNKLNLTVARKRNCEKHDPSERRLKSVYDCEKETITECSDDELEKDRPEEGIKGPLSSLFTPPSPTKSPLRAGTLGGFWGVIPPTPDKASSAMLRRTSLSSKYFPSSQCPNQNFACRPDDNTPPLFLQELAHLSSLACAVALSTLRNDIEGSESVLGIFVPSDPWPASDPDQLPRDIRNEFQHRFRIITIIRHWLGNDRLPHYRSKYNTARPLLIIGGVSDAEIAFLQKARGPHAKVQLALGWLSEFIIREHLQGSLGDVHAAIISRLVQFTSDGMLFYHQARQVMYIPFPFPHAQLSAFFTVVMVVAIPFLMDQYTNVLWIGSLITFLTVTCLVGLHEVARELENPFRNVPNEIPLCTLQAMYNETLVTMFSGYNPDSFWDAEMYRGALEAMAMGKVYQNSNQTEEIMSETASTVPSLAASTPQEAPNSSEKGKHVTFSAKEGSDTSSPACDYHLM